MVWRPEDPQGNESAKVRHMIVPYTRGQGLDLGCGPWKAWPHFIGVDNFDEYQGVIDPATGQHWRPDICADCTDLSLFADRSLDFVYSSHLLEHLDDPRGALLEWWRVIKVDGHLVLYLPHRELYPQIGEPGANPDHKSDFHPEDILGMMDNLDFGGWSCELNQTRAEGLEYSFLLVFRKRRGSGRVRDDLTRARDKRKTCLVVRYGGFGDMLMASSIFPRLREEGYHVTLQTTPRGHEVVRNDPNIDAFWIQDKEQVPNHELTDYWAALSHEFDRCINLSESIEGALLALPDRRNHALSHEARHMALNVNYLDFTHAIAGVPGPGRVVFYPDVAERKWAVQQRKALGENPVIVWGLRGSSVHKIWPWTRDVVAWLLTNTDARIVFAGRREDQILEHAICVGLAQGFLGIDVAAADAMKLSTLLQQLQNYFGGSRIFCHSGSWTIREMLSFLPEASVIVGPETGLLNAASYLEVPKVVMLSHSSRENLTRDWVNTRTIEPEKVACFPCHRMHYDHTYCPQDQASGAAVCAAMIRRETVYDAIRDALYSPQPERIFA